MSSQVTQKEKIVFFLTVFIAGLCSLIYELLISSTSSYFLGDSIKQFSLTIGVYMAAMGLGSYLTKLITDELLDWFVKIEIALGLIGGASVPILYFAYEQLTSSEYQFVTLAITFLVGLFTGFEIPLLVRILKTYYPLKSNLAYVLSLDYIGALIATLLFPFLLLPFVGTFRTSIAFGMVNILLGLLIYRFFTNQLAVKKKRTLEWSAVIALFLFLVLSIYSGKLLDHWENGFYSSTRIYSKQTPYQHLVLTKNKKDIRLYINRIIQFSSVDEYRYHESLALVPAQAAPYKKNILVLGGGEGLLARELLKFTEIENITIVDLDPEVFKLGKENPYVSKINGGALHNEKVNLVSDDAMAFLKNTDQYFDLIISDLPDPSNESVARLYSSAFFKLIKTRLTPYGVFATQATSPFHTNKAFWCIYETVKNSGFNYTYPYHTYVPSFGDWGFVLATDYAIENPALVPQVQTQYLDSIIVKKLFYFEQDIDHPGDIEVNQLDRLPLLDYFLKEWSKWKKEKTN